MSINQQINILMVDDQPSKLLSYQAILGDLGENLISASSGREALDILLKNDIAIILMDVSMPELNGFELAEMIHQHPRFQNIAILFISAVHLSDLDRIKGYQRGAMDYISVPIVPELLRAKVSLFIDLHRKTRELELLNVELEQRVLARTKELEDSAQQIRRLNDQLQQRVDELETIMRVLPIGIAVARDPQCQEITGNTALSTMLDVQQGDKNSFGVDGHLGADFYQNGRRLAPHEYPLNRAAATGISVDMAEMEIHHSNGEVTQVLASANPLFDESGKVRGAVGALTDITARKRMEQVLKERAELMDLASEAIIVRDLDGMVRFWNSGAAALYGWSTEEAVGKNLHQLLRTIFPVSLEDIELTLLQGKRWEGNLVQHTKNGHEIVVACRKSMQRSDRNPIAILEICRDITAELQAEEALRKSDKLAAMGRMAGIVAHEINNPLGAITNVFYLLQNHPSLDAEARNYARMAEQELERVAHITRQTLSFYRETSHPVMVSIRALLEEILELHKSQLYKSNIAVDRRYTSGGFVQGFPGELKQVLLNLVSNAIEAMPNGGRIRVHVGECPEAPSRPRGVRIFVSDNGSGIDPADAKRLFEPFFSTKSSKGTGLGLWISRGILQKYEGTIRFRSVCLGGRKVTCFSIFIPSSAQLHHLQPHEVMGIEAEAETMR
ncbi:MAG: hybrid sensor histidine kinase/response regulator [Acidobacteriaceae bacterium]